MKEKSKKDKALAAIELLWADLGFIRGLAEDAQRDEIESRLAELEGMAFQALQLTEAAFKEEKEVELGVVPADAARELSPAYCQGVLIAVNSRDSQDPGSALHKAMEEAERSSRQPDFISAFFQGWQEGRAIRKAWASRTKWEWIYGEVGMLRGKGEVGPLEVEVYVDFMHRGGKAWVASNQRITSEGTSPAEAVELLHATMARLVRRGLSGQ